MRKKSAISLTSYEDLFKEESTVSNEEGERIQQVELDSLQEFPNHPYSVPDNEELDLLAESIRENGVLHPIIVFPKEDGNGYLIISGHRRCAGARKIGLAEIPAIIRKDISLAQATIEMVDTNIYRETILPSEKAKAYQMRMNAMREELQGKRSASNLREVIADQVGESSTMIHRYLRLNYLIPELLTQIDNNVISLYAGNTISFLEEEKQKEIAKYMRPTGISMEQAEKLRKLSEASLWDKANVKHILRNPIEKKAIRESVFEDEEELEEINQAELKRQIEKELKAERMRDSFNMETIRERIEELSQKEEITVNQRMELEGLKLLSKRMISDFYLGEPQDLPEMEELKDIRKWLHNYHKWPVWNYDAADSSRYFRFDCSDNTSIVVKATPYSDMLAEKIDYKLKYYVIPENGEYITLSDCEKTERDCMEHIKSVILFQQEPTEEETEEPVMVL